MKNGAVNFMQISDIHLFADPKQTLLGVPTQESLEAVLKLVDQEQNELDFILLSGDLSQDGTETSYRRLGELVSKFNLPVYYVAGNHDNSKIMTEVYPMGNVVNDKQLVFPQWQLILLDSHLPGRVEGALNNEQLQFMENCLRDKPDLHAIIVFHHQPVSVGSEWLEPLGVRNAEKFWETIKSYPQIKTILFGHIHQVYDQVYQGIQLYSAPAVCFQFKSHQADFGLEDLPQGLRKVTLHADGKLETEIKRVPNYVGFFDKEARGY